MVQWRSLSKLVLTDRPARLMPSGAVGPRVLRCRVLSSRFGAGGAVDNAVRQPPGLFGTAPAVMLVGQPDADTDSLRTAVFCPSDLGLASARPCLPLQDKNGWPDAAATHPTGDAPDSSTASLHPLCTNIPQGVRGT